MFKRFFDLITFGLFRINTEAFDDAFNLDVDECDHDWEVKAYVPVIGTFRFMPWEESHPLKDSRFSIHTEKTDYAPRKDEIIHPLAGCIATCTKCRKSHVDPDMSSNDIKAAIWLEERVKVSTKEYDAYKETHLPYRGKVLR